MFGQILTMMKNAIAACFTWFFDIVTDLGALHFIIVTLIMVLFIGHVILLRVNGLGSDTVDDSVTPENRKLYARLERQKARNDRRNSKYS